MFHLSWLLTLVSRRPSRTTYYGLSDFRPTGMSLLCSVSRLLQYECHETPHPQAPGQLAAILMFYNRQTLQSIFAHRIRGSRTGIVGSNSDGISSHELTEGQCAVVAAAAGADQVGDCDHSLDCFPIA